MTHCAVLLSSHYFIINFLSCTGLAIEHIGYSSSFGHMLETLLGTVSALILCCNKVEERSHHYRNRTQRPLNQVSPHSDARLELSVSTFRDAGIGAV